MSHCPCVRNVCTACVLACVIVWLCRGARWRRHAGSRVRLNALATHTITLAFLLPRPPALCCRMEAKLRDMEQRMQLGVGASAATAIVTPVADDGTKMFRFDDSLASAAELASAIASSATTNGSAGTNGSSKKAPAVNGHATKK